MSSSFKILFRLIILYFSLIILSGCESRSNDDLVQFVKTAYQNEKPEIEPLPPVEPYEEFLYSASNLADPFDRNNVLDSDVIQEDENKLNSNRRKEPLEAFPLDGLKIDGVLEFRGQLSAIMRTPTGEAVPVQVGNYMGQNNGKILSIDSESQIIELEEIVKNATGNFVKRIVTVTGESSDTSAK